MNPYQHRSLTMRLIWYAHSDHRRSLVVLVVLQQMRVVMRVLVWCSQVYRMLLLLLLVVVMEIALLVKESLVLHVNRVILLMGHQFSTGKVHGIVVQTRVPGVGHVIRDV